LALRPLEEQILVKLDPWSLGVVRGLLGHRRNLIRVAFGDLSEIGVAAPDHIHDVRSQPAFNEDQNNCGHQKEGSNEPIFFDMFFRGLNTTAFLLTCNLPMG
jgi:hypothetical protein